MRKLLLILAVMVILPIAVFADLGVGGAAFYKSPVLIGQDKDTENMNVDQFTFGGDLRLKLGWFQGEILVLYAGGDVNSLNTYLDAGVALDVSILRLSVGAGPNFIYNIGERSPAQVGLNAKLGADVVVGPVSFGLSYIMAMNIDNGLYVNTGSGLLGAQVLFWM